MPTPLRSKTVPKPPAKISQTDPMTQKDFPARFNSSVSPMVAMMETKRLFQTAACDCVLCNDEDDGI